MESTKTNWPLEGTKEFFTYTPGSHPARLFVSTEAMDEIRKTLRRTGYCKYRDKFVMARGLPKALPPAQPPTDAPLELAALTDGGETGVSAGERGGKDTGGKDTSKKLQLFPLPLLVCLLSVLTVSTTLLSLGTLELTARVLRMKTGQNFRNKATAFTTALTADKQPSQNY